MTEYKKQESRGRAAGNQKSSSRKQKRKKDRVRQRNLRLILVGVVLLAVAALVGVKLCKIAREKEEARRASMALEDPLAGAPPLDVQLLTVNEYSRPGISMEKVNYIAIHYTANPGSSAIANRNYFENLKDSHETKASSHFIVGLEGEIVQCIPTAEISYATNERNVDSVSIECCHADESGQFNEATYQSVVELTAWLCNRFGLSIDAVIRHYDVTGKDCPRYYVQNPDAWEQLKADIQAKMEE